MKNPAVQSFVARHGIISWAILCAGLVLTAAAAWFTHRHVAQEAHLRFNGDARELQRRVETEIRNYEEVLVGLRAFFAARDSVSRLEFRRYVESLGLGRRYPGFQALNFAQLVRAEELQQFEAQVRGEGFPEFAVRPGGPRSEYQVINYIEPMESNLPSFGLDIDANPAVAQARVRVRDTGELVTSGRLVRLDGPGQQFVALAMRLGVYRNDRPAGTVEDRRSAFIGSVGAGYRVRDMMRGAVDFERLGHIRYRLYDRGPVAAPVPSESLKADMLLFDSRELAPPAIAAMYDQVAERALLAESVSFPVGGRLWEVKFATPLRLSAAERLVPPMVLLVGLLGSALLFRLYRQITGSKHRAEASLSHLSTHDPLTGLPNRLLFSDRLAGALERGGRNGLAVLLIDLDRFKNINDSLGHGAGDAVLKACAVRLSRALRDTDLVAHLSGDEFAVIVEPCLQPAAAIAVARKILHALERPLFVQGHEIVPTGSIGIAVHGEDGSDIETLLKHADIALFRAKENGRNNYQFYTEKLNPHGLKRLTLEAALRRALERNEFELHYQPKMDLRSGEAIGVEALIRWKHAELGMVPPGQFIPVAEESGLIEPIGAWVLREACRQAREWQDAGHEGVRIAVNLSARQFRNQRLASEIRKCLSATGTDASLIELELTESMVMHDPEQTARTLNELKAMGLTLSIDDFGTGHSSLAYLKRFPIDSVKVDRSFIKDLPGDAEDAAIVNSVIALARSLRLRVVAEGVETVEQQQHLRSAGCDEMQGYLFSRPLAAQEAAQFLARHRGRPSRPALLVVS
jgi:diguanylate cyclase (GGDEF)-like protein